MLPEFTDGAGNGLKADLTPAICFNKPDDHQPGNEQEKRAAYRCRNNPPRFVVINSFGNAVETDGNQANRNKVGDNVFVFVAAGHQGDLNVDKHGLVPSKLIRGRPALVCALNLFNNLNALQSPAQ